MRITKLCLSKTHLSKKPSACCVSLSWSRGTLLTWPISVKEAVVAALVAGLRVRSPARPVCMSVHSPGETILIRPLSDS